MTYLIESRRQRPGDDPIFALNSEAKKRAAAGEDVVNATIGALLTDEGKLAVMPSVIESLAQVPAALAAGYAPIAGRPEFRQAVIDDLLGPHGMADMAANVATPGGTGALRMAMDDFSEPGQKVLTSSFFWGPYRTLASESGRELATFNMFDAQGRFDTADLERALVEILAEQKRALLILNTPCHNPTGYSLDQTEWDGIVDVVARHSDKGPIVVLMDVAYGYYQPEGMRLCLENLRRLVGKALVCFAWSASKTFLQYGLRIGSLVAVSDDDGERRLIANAMTYSCRGIWSNCNAGGMAAIARVLTEPELCERSKVERTEHASTLARRVVCWNSLATEAGLHYPRYNGGFFTTVFSDRAPEVAAELREMGIYLVPLGNALSVAMCAVNEEQIARVVQGLESALKP